MSGQKQEETRVSFTQAELSAVIATAVQAAIRELGPKSPGSPDQQAEAWKEHMRPAGREDVRSVKCQSTETGATFTAIVTPSRKYPEGRVVSLEDYRQPEDAAEKLPEGMRQKNPDGTWNMAAKQWLFQNYWQADLIRYVGKPLPAHVQCDVQAKIKSLGA